MTRIIYGLTDTSRSLPSIFYVGMTTKPAQVRFKSHINEAVRGIGKVDTKKNRKVAKLLKTDSLDYVILEQDDAWAPDELAQKEKWWIAYFKSEGISLTNLTDGGDGTIGYKFSKKQVESIKLGIAKAFAERGESIRKQMSNSSRNRWDNTNERAMQSEKMKNSEAAKKHREALHSQLLGTPLSEEHKKAISKGTQDFFNAHPEIGQAHSIRMKKMLQDSEYRKQISEKSKAVFQDPLRREVLIENRRKAAAISNLIVVECANCGMITKSGPLGVHLKASGHSKKQ